MTDVQRAFTLHWVDERCYGHGRCNAAAPELFDLDEEGRGVLLNERPPAELRAAAVRAAENCPEQAIVVGPDEPA
jgi:ferredoxin